MIFVVVIADRRWLFALAIAGVAFGIAALLS